MRRLELTWSKEQVARLSCACALRYARASVTNDRANCENDLFTEVSMAGRMLGLEQSVRSSLGAWMTETLKAHQVRPPGKSRVKILETLDLLIVEHARL